MHLLLIGPRASGKTTIGRSLAERLGWPFVDLDDRTRARFDEPSIESIWRIHGEPGWREAEVMALGEVLDEAAAVIALGGGTPMIPSACVQIDRSRSGGSVRVIYLQCPAAALEKRLRAETGDRPSLTGQDPVSEVAAVLASREPVYRAIADTVIDASGPPQQVVDEIVRALGPGSRRD